MEKAENRAVSGSTQLLNTAAEREELAVPDSSLVIKMNSSALLLCCNANTALVSLPSQETSILFNYRDKKQVITRKCG